jgi:peptide deformylase
MSDTTVPEVLEIVRYPDPVLRRTAAPVVAVDDEVRAMAEAMVRTMNASRGLGLSANQVGWLRRVIVVSGTGEPDDTRVAVNPVVVSEDGSVALEEGCLSFPGMFGLITRPARIRVRYVNLAGETVEEDADGMLARCYLHEIDHLDGVLFITRMTPADRMRVKRTLREMEEEFAGPRPVRR